MAKNTVEYFSSKLGSGVINNAASEATLQEIVRYYKDNSNNNRGGDDDVADEAGAAGTSLKLLKKGFTTLTAGLSNTVSAGKNFISMIARGEDKLSAYGKFIQDDLIKKLPVVGDTLGDLAGIVTETIVALESWNDGLREANKHGATFNYSIFKFKETALDMGLSTDELVSLVGSNAETLVSLGGGTMTTGIDNLRKLSAAMFMDSDKVSDILDRWGYNTYQQNDLLLEFYAATRRGKAVTEKNLNSTSNEFLQYASQIDAFQKITGMGKEQRQEAAAAANQDISYKLKVGKLLPAQQARMETALQSFSMVFGAQGAELFKSRELGVQSINDTVIALQYALGPSFERSMDTIIKMAKDTSVSPKVFEDYVNNTIGSQLANSKEAMRELEGIIKGSVSGNESSKKLVKALTPAMEFMIKQGGLSKNMQSQFVKMVEAAKKEQGKTDAFTDTLRKFQRSVYRVYRALLKGFFPVMKDLAKEFKIAMVPDQLRAFNKYLIQLANDALPYVKNFFANLTDDDTLVYMKNIFEGMFEAAIIYFHMYMRKAIYSTFNVEGAAKWLAKIGIGPDLDRMAAAAEAKLGFAKESGRQIFLPKEERRMPVNPEDEKVVIDGKTYYIRDLLRGSDGRFRSYGSVYEGGSGSEVTNAALTAAILALRERKAQAGASIIDDSDQFGGLTLLQREAVANLLNKNIRGIGTNLNPLRRVMFDAKMFAQTKDRNLPKIQKIMERKEYADEVERLRKEYPSTYMGMNTGTLGTLGGLFGNFKRGTMATLHGKEAVVSPGQLQNVINTSAQISMRDVVKRLNSNINRMIDVAKQDVGLERSKLLAMT